MKTLKLLIISSFAVIMTLWSCSNNDNLDENLFDPLQSETTQRVIDDGTPVDGMHPTNNLIFDFCFEFVFPIELIYNNGTTVIVNNLEELITVIINSTDELYIVGIVFPFDVLVYNHDTNEIEQITIHNEEEFIDLLENCDFNGCDCDDEWDPVCVEIEENGTVTIITFPNACHAECEGFTEDEYYECDGCDCPDEYNPVCVEIENDIIVFHNACFAECEGFTEDEYYECDGCDCPDEYNPVCVEIEGEIIEFDNACFAECEGFTEEDFVDCPVEMCDIYELHVEVGECNPDGTYSITINFEYENPENEHFDVFIRDNVHIGTYSLSNLPLTIEHFEVSDFEYDYLKVCINDQPDCCEDIEWMAPDCSGSGECDIYDLHVEIGDCIPGTILYELTIDFEYENVNNEYFDVYLRNDEFFGYFELAALPLTIENFPLSGFDHDFIKVCINDNPECCEAIEWEAPECNTIPCGIYDLIVDVGNCNPGTDTYSLTIDFEYENPGNDYFDVFVRDDVFIGHYSLGDLPITIEDFELSGFDYDFIKVCINDNPECCDAIEWESPDC
jgi:hypothetical protein